ncbi:MAG: aminoacetone oxidase family FAD-binding enzyme [Ruminococcus sp.]|nr:aminoacetone oxidase family FAD-binding enzyme [Ruminococcus sp.]
MYADIVIIGGGASGYSSAISAKKTNPSADVVIVEKLSRTGKKIIATGNGKCNLSNISITEKNYHGSLNTVKIINNTPDWYELFERELGVMCVQGSEGRSGGIYPHSNSSSTVVNAFRLKIGNLGIKEVCDFEVKSIDGIDGYYIIKSYDKQIISRKIIIATGGYASPSFGTDGGMLRIFRERGYKISKICPAVSPLKVSSESLKGLKGVRVKGEISAISDGKTLRTERGEIQFNENNISGVCVFNLAYLFQKYGEKLSLYIDLLPEMDFESVFEYIKNIKKDRAECSIDELLTGIFVRNMAVYLMKNTLRRTMTDKIKSLTDGEIRGLVRRIKGLNFDVSGCASWQNAQATCGGIHGDCVTENLESRLETGIYFCGEVLDTVGDCGGYNLQWAWSSGLWAGKKCAESLKGGRND